MALRPVPSEADWPDEIAEAVIPEFEGVIDVLVPGKRGKLDPKTDTRLPGEPDVILIGARACRIQRIGSSSRSSGAADLGNKRRYRFQIERRSDDPFIPEGAIVRVLDGGREPWLTQYSYGIESTGGSDVSALRTIETIAEFAAVS